MGVFGVIFLWLNRFNTSRSSYKLIVEFANAGGMQKGSSVRYRGVKVGNISMIRPGANAVDVELEIIQPDLVIPKDVVVEANQSGLISESIIDITPKTSLPSGVTIAKPLDQNCDRQEYIVCNGSRLKGQIGISIDQLIRSSTELATLYNDPKFYQNVNRLIENSSLAAASVAGLSQDLRILSKSAQRQLGTFSSTANSFQRATNQLTISTTKTVSELGSTAKQFSLTANQANRLLTNLDNLVTSNRSSLVSALNNITQVSDKLLVTVNGLSPAVNRLTQGELLKNLETLSVNAAQASANLRDASQTLNDPKNLVLLQQTLDSARVTFENTQKITSDLDELTGDPAFRKNLRQLVNGLSNLVSSTEQMQQQVQVATTLDSLKASIDQLNAEIPIPNTKRQTVTINPATGALKKTDIKSPATTPIIPISSQQRLLKRLQNYQEQQLENRL
jgi:phospholipid/cholesterol/gamma-HCH transport system substrate-binding protein